MTTEINAGAQQEAAPADNDNGRGIYDLTHTPLKDGSLSTVARHDVETLVLRAVAREHIATPEALTAFLPRMQARFGALLAALDKDSPATHAFGHRFDADYKTHVKAGNEHAMAMQDVQSIFHNRAGDIAATLPLFTDPAFAQALVARIGEAPALNTALSGEKLQEIKRALTADGNGGIDTPIHFKRNFLEHHKVHAALMDAFTPGSDVAQKLGASLVGTLPQEDTASLKAFLDDWLTLRAERARGVMEATRPDGELAQSAVKEWAALHGTGKEEAGQNTPSTVIQKAGKLYEALVAEVANENLQAQHSA